MQLKDSCMIYSYFFLSPVVSRMQKGNQFFRGAFEWRLVDQLHPALAGSAELPVDIVGAKRERRMSELRRDVFVDLGIGPLDVVSKKIGPRLIPGQEILRLVERRIVELDLSEAAPAKEEKIEERRQIVWTT